MGKLTLELNPTTMAKKGSKPKAPVVVDKGKRKAISLDPRPTNAKRSKLASSTSSLKVSNRYAFHC